LKYLKILTLQVKSRREEDPRKEIMRLKEEYSSSSGHKWLSLEKNQSRPMASQDRGGNSKENTKRVNCFVLDYA
jgi:hypothetical protein